MLHGQVALHEMVSMCGSTNMTGMWLFLALRGAAFASGSPGADEGALAGSFEGPGWSSDLTSGCVAPPLRRPGKQCKLTRWVR